MTRTIRTSLVLSGVLLALGLAVLPFAAHATEQCADLYDGAAKAADGKDIKGASALLDKAGSCCASDMEPAAAQKIIGDIKAIVAAASAATAKGSNKEDAGKALADALGCAGQPSIVAIDPNLYSSVLLDSANFAELARDEDGGLGKEVQLARQLPGNHPSNNQQPTVSIEQK